jgi:hypothetical protein
MKKILDIPERESNLQSPISNLQSPISNVLAGRQFQALATVPLLAQRGAFVVAMYDTILHRQALVAQLRQQVAPQPLFEFTVTPLRPDVHEYLVQMTPQQQQERAVVCIYDIECVWPDAARYLDRQRDVLSAYPHTLVLWIERYTRGPLAQAAPNFFSRHSGVFDLCALTEAPRIEIP